MDVNSEIAFLKHENSTLKSNIAVLRHDIAWLKGQLKHEHMMNVKQQNVLEQRLQSRVDSLTAKLEKTLVQISTIQKKISQ